MGLFGKMKDFIGLEEVYDDEEITEEEIEAASAKLERKQVESRASYASKDKATVAPDRKEAKDQKVTPISQPRVSSATTALKLVVIEPSSFDEAPKLVDSLKARKPIIINLVNLDQGVARKIFDFLSGATYALNGNVQRIADSIFVFAPENVDIAANIDHQGIDFSGGKNSIWR